MTENRKTRDSNGGAVTLKAVAAHLGLSPGTVSAVLNDAPSAKHIPKVTRERIVAAARKLDYRPNFFARSLRKQRTFTIGVIAQDRKSTRLNSSHANISYAVFCLKKKKKKIKTRARLTQQ